mgnify:CR=1 FL=1
MKTRRKYKIIGGVMVTLLLVVACLMGASFYMLDYSLGYTQQDRKTAEAQRNRIRKECPWTMAWMDSIYQNHTIKDTFVVMPSGYKGHALYLYAPKPTDKTAVVVHGYKVRAEGMLHIAYLYNHDMRYNVLLPDLYGHGESEGDHIQMGWKDRWDVVRWSEVADEIFSKSRGAMQNMSLKDTHTQQVLRGYSSVWDEFAAQLKDQFGLPSFPLMNTTSRLCKLKYGWSFAEAQQIEQVRKSTKPMLFIHGDKDDFVPYRMLQPLYEAKTKGKKAIFIAKGSIHAMAYRDQHEEYTKVVKEFLQ